MLTGPLLTLLALTTYALAAPAPQELVKPAQSERNKLYSHSVYWRPYLATEIKGKLYVQNHTVESPQDCADYCTPRFGIAIGLWVNSENQCSCYSDEEETVIYSGPQMTIFLKQVGKRPVFVSDATFKSEKSYGMYNMEGARFRTTNSTSNADTDQQCAVYCDNPAVPHQVGFVVARGDHGYMQCECIEVFSSTDDVATAELEPGKLLNGDHAYLINGYESRIRSYEEAQKDIIADSRPNSQSPMMRSSVSSKRFTTKALVSNKFPNQV